MTIIAYDLGTGGCKASLYDETGTLLSSDFFFYDTYYPHSGWHEQRPDDWWQAVVTSTKRLLAKSGIDKSAIRYLALSGQSLAVIPLDANGNLLRDLIPIWSDTRATEQVKQFFEKLDVDQWYKLTGNGFSPATYSVFKMMWYRDNEPEIFSKIHKIVGSKDYINFRLTGNIYTDHSYASGCGFYNLRKRAYDPDLLATSGLSIDLFPEIVESTFCVGNLTELAAQELSLTPEVQVYCGGVDNSCMALGAGNFQEGRIYLSLGSSAWFAVSSAEPVIDVEIKPFVFAHVIPSMYTSATSIFSAGSSFRWLRDNVFSEYLEMARQQKRDPYDLMVETAMQSPIGANGLFFNPSLAGASAAYPNPAIRGAFMGLDLRHTRSDIIRAVLEGITFDLYIMYTKLAKLVELQDTILMVGGGGNSASWRQMFANVFNKPFARSPIGQDAASLGAAVVAGVGAGLWNDFYIVDEIIKPIEITYPEPDTVKNYQKITPVYARTWEYLSAIADLMADLQ